MSATPVSNPGLVPQGSLRLRPMGVADMLDAAVGVYRRHFLKLIMITALITVPITALDMVLRLIFIIPMTGAGLDYNASYETAMTNVWIAQGLNLALALMVAAVNYGVIMPALVWAAGQGYVGNPLSLRAAYGKVLRRLPIIVLIFLFYLAAALVLGVFSLVPCVGWLGAPALWLYVSMNLLALMLPVVMLENSGVGVSLKRGWLLTRSNFWRAFGLVVALYFFGVALTSGPSVLASALVVALAGQPGLVSALSSGLGAVINLVYMPIWSIGLTLLYYDTRVRCEALDLQLLAGIMTRPETTVQQMTWFDKTDWKKLAILTGIMLGLIGLCVGLYFLLVAFVMVGSAL
jgi:hypothetical protein